MLLLLFILDYKIITLLAKLFLVGSIVNYFEVIKNKEVFEKVFDSFWNPL